MKLRRLIIATHRDIGYFFAGLTVLYAISGVAVNHIDDWNPNYVIRREIVEVGVLPFAEPAELGAEVLDRMSITDEPRSVVRMNREELKVFLDQRTFGWVNACHVVPDARGVRVPDLVRGIAPDPLDPTFDIRAVARSLRSHRVEVKRLMLNQDIVSGIGNIYADEALWAAGVHPRRRADRLSLTALRDVLEAATTVMSASLAQGGTSFDSLYVNVNGESGYFSRGLAVYGLAGQPCRRCGTPIVRERFMNRSSHFCPTCQRPPRSAH